MSTVFVIFICSLATVFLAAWVAARFRVSREKFSPRLVVENGRFENLAAAGLGAPDNLLRLVHSGSESGQDNEMPAFAADADRNLRSQTDSDFANKALWGAAAADAVIPGVEVWARWASVDNHVFSAISHLTHEHVSGVADLINIVDAKGYAIESVGFFNKLLGHLGEWHVQEHLINAGAAVSMPISSNEPGLDFWVDGHAVNIKTVADAASLGGHFSSYPDIPTIIPFDADHIPTDALHFNPLEGFDSNVLAGGDHLTMVDDALSHAQMVSEAHGAINVLQNPGPALHFPYVTLAVSSFRELNLLSKGHTDFLRATKNVATDTVAVGGGGAVGIKTGAFVGAFFGPIGAVVGGVIGGIGGAMGGRAIANGIKKAPLNEAREGYERAFDQCTKQRNELLVAVDAELVLATGDASQNLSEMAVQVNSQTEVQLAEIKDELGRKMILDLQSATAILDQTESRILSLLKSEKQTLKADCPSWAVLFPGLAFPSRVMAIKQLRMGFKKWRKMRNLLLQNWQVDAISTTRCFDLVLATPDGLNDAQRFLLDVDLARKSALSQAGEAQKTALQTIVEMRMQVVESLKECFRQIQERVERELSPHMDKLKKRRSSYEAELRSAGVKF